MHRNTTVAIVQLFVVVAISVCAGVAHAQTKVACIGDSITAPRTSWCGGLAELLGNEYTVSNFGVTATTLLKNVGQPAYSSSNQYRPSHDFAPNIVVIMLGTNDSASRNWNAGKDHFVQDYEELIDSYTSLASKPTVFLNTPPPASDDNTFTISGTTIENEIIPLIKQVAMTKMCPFVDVWAAFDGDVENLGSFDGVHPGAAGQMTIAEAVYEAIQSPMVPGGNAGAGGSAGSAGSADAGGGGNAGGSTNTGGAGAGGGSVNAGGGGMAGGSVNTAGSGMAGSSANTGGSAGLVGAAGTASAGGNASTVNAIGAAGSAPVVAAPETSDGGCRATGNFTSKSSPTAVLLLLLGMVVSRGRRSL